MVALDDDLERLADRDAVRAVGEGRRDEDRDDAAGRPVDEHLRRRLGSPGVPAAIGSYAGRSTATRWTRVRWSPTGTLRLEEPGGRSDPGQLRESIATGSGPVTR